MSHDETTGTGSSAEVTDDPNTAPSTPAYVSAPNQGNYQPHSWWHILATVMIVLAVLCGGATIVAYSVYDSYRANAAADKTAIDTTKAAVTKAGWQPVGDYTIGDGMIKGKVAFGTNCVLYVAAPRSLPDQVTLTVVVIVAHNPFGIADTTRTHSWPLSNVTPDRFAQSATQFNLGDCLPLRTYNG